jgi:hypothetical protein
MGQKIELKTTSFNKNIIFDLNRSLSGQDGITYHNIAGCFTTRRSKCSVSTKTLPVFRRY